MLDNTRGIYLYTGKHYNSKYQTAKTSPPVHKSIPHLTQKATKRTQEKDQQPPPSYIQ